MNHERCPWCGTDPLYVRYHDEEWGVPVHDDRKVFEFLVLESAQAGLSWITILRRREGYRRAFAGFDPEAIARFGEEDVARLMGDVGIIRNQAKIRATIGNARAFLAFREARGPMSRWLWARVGGRPILNHASTLKDLPATTPLSDDLAKEFRSLGFRFLGSTVLYAHLQATGFVNDHLLGCPRRAEIAATYDASPMLPAD